MTDSLEARGYARWMDILQLWPCDRERAQERKCYHTSTRWNGTDGPLGRRETYRVNFHGEEAIELPAERFKDTHFTINSDLIKVPTSHLWVAGEDKILLRYNWDEFDLEYVVASWKVER